MVKLTDSETINRIIIELAKDDVWLSRNQIKERTGKPIKTIKTYLDKEINHLVKENKLLIPVKRRTRIIEDEVKHYRLKDNIDDLLAVFNYLHDRKFHKELMQTKYFQVQIPSIIDKLKTIIPEITEASETEEGLNYILSSPIAVHSILKISPREIAFAPQMSQIAENCAKSILKQANLNEARYDEIIKDIDFTDISGLTLTGLYSVAFLDSLRDIDMEEIKSGKNEKVVK